MKVSSFLSMFSEFAPSFLLEMLETSLHAYRVSSRRRSRRKSESKTSASNREDYCRGINEDEWNVPRIIVKYRDINDQISTVYNVRSIKHLYFADTALFSDVRHISRIAEMNRKWKKERRKKKGGKKTNPHLYASIFPRFALAYRQKKETSKRKKN